MLQSGGASTVRAQSSRGVERDIIRTNKPELWNERIRKSSLDHPNMVASMPDMNKGVPEWGCGRTSRLNISCILSVNVINSNHLSNFVVLFEE
jgi:hypothetical protein